MVDGVPGGVCSLKIYDTALSATSCPAVAPSGQIARGSYGAVRRVGLGAGPVDSAKTEAACVAARTVGCIGLRRGGLTPRITCPTISVDGRPGRALASVSETSDRNSRKLSALTQRPWRCSGSRCWPEPAVAVQVVEAALADRPSSRPARGTMPLARMRAPSVSPNGWLPDGAATLPSEPPSSLFAGAVAFWLVPLPRATSSLPQDAANHLAAPALLRSACALRA